MEADINISHDANYDLCVICRQRSNETLNIVRPDGIQTLIQSCEARGNTQVQNYIQSCTASVLVHHSCRKSFNDLRKLKRSKIEEEACSSVSRSLRSSIDSFEWKLKCLLCSKDCDKMKRDTHSVSTLELTNRLRQICEQRKDDWAVEVSGRLESCNDLVAEEAVYHHSCYFKFTQYRKLVPNESHRGRPDSANMTNSFNELCNWLEERFESDLFTLQELHKKMSDENDNIELYSIKHLKRKLIERYGEHIAFNEVCGRRDVVCFRDVGAYIISDKWYTDRHTQVLGERERMIHAAAKLIASSVRDMDFDMKRYPNYSDIQDSMSNSKWMPDLLKLFMQTLIGSDIKCSTISQCIVQAARPRSALMPLLLGVSLSIDQLSGSKDLVKEIARLGLCLSYDELTRFKHSVINSQPDGVPDVLPEEQLICSSESVDEETETVVSEDSETITQFVADNVDHDIRTLTGSGTFHGMGIISCTTRVTGKISTPKTSVVRLPKRLTAKQIVKNRGIPIIQYSLVPKIGLSCIKFTDIDTIKQCFYNPSVCRLSLLWYASLLCNNVPRPNWSGFMQQVSTGCHGSVANVQMLPLIDLNPGDESCIYSTLLFIESRARQLNVTTPCITFDQPLWIKAVDIINASGLDIVCRLGGFHLLMNFLGSIGSVMNGSGLNELFQLNYGMSTIVHMMTGKAFARALRAHFLVEGALVFKLLKCLCDSAEITRDDENVLGTLIVTAVSQKVTGDDSDVLEDPVLIKMETCLQRLMNDLSQRSRTAKLWIQYIYYIGIIKRFIIAERTGDWHLHLMTTGDMLNLLAATGHHNYAKCARLYLQMMSELPTSHPWLYKQFSLNGFHTVRRTDRYWAGLSTDLLIEQTMMKSIKSRTGLTHGRGMTEAVRLVWTHCIHECANWHLSMKTLTGMATKESHHAECSAPRINRDQRERQKAIVWLDNHDPFCTADTRLRSLSSGVTASEADNINCDDAESVGARMQKKFDNISFSNAAIKKIDTVRSFIHIGTKSVHKKQISADAGSLFHRLLILVNRSADIPAYFNHELMAYPASLFKDGFMRKADKPSLARTISVGCQISVMLPKETVFVVDGGALLHKVRWLKCVTFSDVMIQYIRYILSRFGEKAVIVFDGYESGPTTKDHEHKRRSSKVSRSSPEVAFTLETPVATDQHSFLSNIENKIHFITLLNDILREQNFSTALASADADTDIVTAALRLAATGQVVAVAADDTDVLVLLVHHMNSSMGDIYFSYQNKIKNGSDARIFSIRSIQDKIGAVACQQILTIHAIGGCDTTSAVFGVGKGTVFKKLSCSSSVQGLVTIFQDENATTDQVSTSGQQLLSILYCGNPGEKLNKLRYMLYCKMVSESSVRPRPEKLPPTQQAAFFHVLRAHLQVIRWKTLDSGKLDACLWGWKLEEGMLQPIMTNLPAAPDDVLNIVRCKCKSASPCQTSLCSCRRNGLFCVASCNSCHGESCSNKDQSMNNDCDVETDSASECDDDPEIDNLPRYYFDSDDCENEELVDYEDSASGDEM